MFLNVIIMKFFLFETVSQLMKYIIPETLKHFRYKIKTIAKLISA